MGVFLCGQSFLSTYGGAMPFFPCVRGDLFFCMGGGGHYWACPPITSFAGASCHKNFSRSWRF